MPRGTPCSTRRESRRAGPLQVRTGRRRRRSPVGDARACGAGRSPSPRTPATMRTRSPAHRGGSYPRPPPRGIPLRRARSRRCTHRVRSERSLDATRRSRRHPAAPAATRARRRARVRARGRSRPRLPRARRTVRGVPRSRPGGFSHARPTSSKYNPERLAREKCESGTDRDGCQAEIGCEQRRDERNRQLDVGTMLSRPQRSYARRTCGHHHHPIRQGACLGSVSARPACPGAGPYGEGCCDPSRACARPPPSCRRCPPASA